MFFGLIILRILFVACMVFILGYVFGNFSKNRTLTVFTKIAAITAIVLFVATNVFFFRAFRGDGNGRMHHDTCWQNRNDSIR